MTCKACGLLYSCDHADAEYAGVIAWDIRPVAASNPIAAPDTHPARRGGSGRVENTPARRGPHHQEITQ